jgi:hypothetical protein
VALPGVSTLRAREISFIHPHLAIGPQKSCRTGTASQSRSSEEAVGSRDYLFRNPSASPSHSPKPCSKLRLRGVFLRRWALTKEERSRDFDPPSPQHLKFLFTQLQTRRVSSIPRKFFPEKRLDTYTKRILTVANRPKLRDASSQVLGSVG